MDGGINISDFTRHDDEAFLNFLGEWKVMIGDRRKSSSKGDTVEMLMIMSFIKDTFPAITLPEIKLAVKLSFARELDMAPDLFNNQSFSALYCTSVIKSYILYKNKELAPVIDKWRSAPPPPPEEWTPQQKMDDMKDWFNGVYKTFQEHQIIEDPLNMCYRFLNKSKRFKSLTATQIEDARKFGVEQAAKFLVKEDGSIQEAVAKMKTNAKKGDAIDIRKLQDRYSRNYCVEIIFKKLNSIEQLTNTFKLEEFETKEKAIENKKK